MRGTTTRSLRALLAATTAASLLALPVGAAAQDAEPFGLDLEGEYRMILEDGDYADPSYDDSGWDVTTVPTSDGHEGKWDNYDGYGWFRRSFVLPAEADGLNLVLSAGYLDDADETYLNGVLVGKSGEFPPDSDSQWFERRLYPIPTEALNYGGENVIAVRLNDFSGGGGWYKGPVGIFSKEKLREQVYGIVSEAASSTLTAEVQAVLDLQKQALAAGDVDAYLATLDASFYHDGDDVDRRRRDLEGWLATYDSLELNDTEVEVIVTDDGRLLADTNRSLYGISGADRVELRAPTQDFLRFDASTLKELGNRSRFFRDTVDSELEGHQREFVVYLPPSYFDNPDHRYPTVYMLHGINGGAREWEPREFDRLLDELFTTGGLAESIVIFPDGESLWYVDSSASPWRSMFTTEMLPLVEAEYRTLPQREFRGLSGVSMGGHGAFTVGWAHQELFSGIASHMGALNFPPFSNSSAADETPLVQVTTHTPAFLQSYAYFMDVCAFDDFGFAVNVPAMSAQLNAKLAPNTAVVYPEGRHNDDCWLPHIDASFGMHSENFRANGLTEPPVAPGAGAPEPAPQPDPAPQQPTLPATGGGVAALAVLALAAGVGLSGGRSGAGAARRADGRARAPR